MRNFQGTSETLKRSFISAFSICMTVPLKSKLFEIQKIYSKTCSTSCVNVHHDTTTVQVVRTV